MPSAEADDRTLERLREQLLVAGAFELGRAGARAGRVLLRVDGRRQVRDGDARRVVGGGARQLDVADGDGVGLRAEEGERGPTPRVAQPWLWPPARLKSVGVSRR